MLVFYNALCETLDKWEDCAGTLSTHGRNAILYQNLAKALYLTDMAGSER